MGDEPGDEEPAERLASFHIIRIGVGSVDNDGSRTSEGADCARAQEVDETWMRPRMRPRDQTRWGRGGEERRLWGSLTGAGRSQ